MEIKNDDNDFQPLETVEISKIGPGSISVFDGEGRKYVESNAESDTKFKISGSLGTHIVFYQDENGQIQDQLTFEVDCETEIKDDTGKYQELLDRLYDTLFQDWTQGYTKFLRIDGKQYKYYVSWLRDHVHTLKGMKYWDNDLKTGIELYSDSQREDGMIWDKCKQMCHSEWQTWRDVEFDEGDFVRKIPGNPTRRWMRIPVENDVEYLYIEGLYNTWKACGDDQWMIEQLDNAIDAVNYATSDEYRWSEKFQLLKRGYTIDTWDFQSHDDVERSGTVMRVYPDKSEFNVFYGDNTGMSASCKYLAEMLRVAGRDEEAEEYEAFADTLKERLNDLSWNGDFYTHMIPENPDVKRDLGDTPTDEQVTLSNAYSLNRGISHDKCVQIIKTYQQIREEMPESSVGEWYNCYPPFEKGFHFDKWEYMNGGVSTITAGELARGAFEHGFEDYAVDILQRVVALSEEFGGYLHICYKGKLPERDTQPNYKCVDISQKANVDFYGEGAKGVPGWSNEGKNDMCNIPTGRQEFKGIEFDVIDPEENGRRASLGISVREEYQGQVSIKIDDQAETIYLLHTAAGGDVNGWDKESLQTSLKSPQNLVGQFKVKYSDGSHETQYIETHKQVEYFFLPPPDQVQGESRREGPYRIAWQGSNRIYSNVGIFAYGWSNPHPERHIDEIEFEAVERDAIWLISGITLSDEGVNFPVSKLSFGIPDMWGASALIYSLIEGMAGIIDKHKAFEKVSLKPRWTATEENEVTACAKYPASGGYVRYHYQYNENDNKIKMLISGNAEKMETEILLPGATKIEQVKLNDSNLKDYSIKTIEGSKYLKLDLTGIKVYDLELKLK